MSNCGKVCKHNVDIKIVLNLLLIIYFIICYNMYMCVCVYVYVYIHIIIYTGEGNGNPLQYSCLEKSNGQRHLWRATVHGVIEELDMTELTTNYIYIYIYIYIC